MNCPKCGVENRHDASFCGECGASLAQEVVCSKCQRSNPAGRKFCDGCGQKLGPASAAPAREPGSYTPKHLAEKILTSRSALEGERKTITALFADIKGSMELLEDLDPEEARRVIDPALQLMMDAVHRYEGYVAQSTGDGIFAFFGAPIAHEDHPQRAIYAALLMQEQAERYGDQLQRDRGIRLPIRVGINTGQVVVRSIRTDDLHTDYVPVGHSTSLAARMETLAKTGTVVVSEHTHKLTDGYFQFKALGPARVKGVSEPVEVYEVTGVGPLRTRLQVAARGGLVRFVGRGNELDQMRRAWESTKASRGQIVAVMGEAGVGKSRLVHEFKVPLESQGLVLEAFSVSHGKAHAYLPLIDLLKTYFRIGLQDDERRKREKITGKVLTVDRTLEDTLPYLYALLGIAEPTSSLAQMDPQVRRQRTLEGIKRLLVRESLNQPLLVIFEDLHWIDGETQAFLEVLADSVASAKILLLVNYRPEYQHGWAGKTYYTRLRLDPLGEEEAQELLTALVGHETRAELEPLRQLILDKTEGNPFFMEELVQALVEEGVLAGERGSYQLEKAATELQIPTTVQGVLAARIDRLPPDEKEFVQILSVIGKEFPLGLLRKVACHSEGDLYHLLSHVQAGEFVYEQPAFPEPEYTFKHALTQEVAYQSVLVERRKVLHEQTARAIEELYQDGLDAHYSELAHHYSKTDNTRKAVEYLYLAGQQAVERSAYGEAMQQLATGLKLLRTLPETPERRQQELHLQVSLGSALIVVKGWTAQETEQAYTRAWELWQEARETKQRPMVLGGLLAVCQNRGEHRRACELAEQLMGPADDAQDSSLLLHAESSLGQALHYLGELVTARAHLERAVALYDPSRHHPLTFTYRGIDPGVLALMMLAWTLWPLGYPDHALTRTQEGLTLAQELSHPFSTAYAVAFSGFVHQTRQEWQAAQERADAVIELAREHAFPVWLAFGTLSRGWALAKQGQVEDGIAWMREGMEALRAGGLNIGRTRHLTGLAEIYAQTGRVEEGLAVIAEAEDLVEKTSERYREAETRRVKGELLLVGSADNRAGAETCFRNAIEIARRQSSKSDELRAATSLSRLWQKQGKKEEARQLLAEIYGWFTEGFDTRDLKEAKALLEELL